MLCKLLLALIISLPLVAQADDTLLTPADIHKEMNEIFTVHLTQKHMTKEIMHLALSQYINQFDPHHVYLLASDVAPFIATSDNNLEAMVDQYNKENYTVFEKLNAVIDRAIVKMRKVRSVLAQNPAELAGLEKKLLPTIPGNEISKLTYFAQDENQLEEWYAIYIANLVLADIENLKSLHREISFAEAFGNIEYLLQEHENDYLFRTKNGAPLDAQEKQSLFTLRVLQALTKSVDVHTQFLSPQLARNLAISLQKEYVGVGIGIEEMGAGFIVTSIMKGSSAEASGKIHIGDEISSIDGKSVAGMPSEALLTRLVGKAGTLVILTMKDKNNEPYSVSLMRKEIVLQEGRVDTRYQKVPGGVFGFIKLYGFYQGKGQVTSDQDVKAALLSIKKQGPIKGLILDLRDNPGGFVEQAVKVAGLFIKTGVILVAKDDTGKMHIFRDIDPNVYYTGPLVILISRQTASAAEIVAQSLKDYGVAIIVGDEESFGKGSLQKTNLDGSNPLNVTIGRYFTVGGHSVQLLGVKADIVVPGRLENEKVGEEYLSGTLENETIPPLFIDPLRDIPNFEKPWYNRFYRPFIQQPTDRYRKWIPELKELSERRMKANANYQNLLHNKLEITENNRVITLTPEQAEKTLSDLQEQETTNILTDLVRLSSH